MTWLALAATLMLVTTAGTLVWRTGRGARSQPQPPPAAPPPAELATTPSPGAALPLTSGTPQPAVPAPAPAVDTPSLTQRRGAVRQINGKTFRLVAGEWLDSAYDPLGLLPVQRVSDPEGRAAVLARVPALLPFAKLGPRVLVVQDGVVYRFSLPTGLPAP